MTECFVADASALATLGHRLAGVLKPGDVVGLEGPLGAGKTTLVRALLDALGHPGPVRSPTYTLVETYELERLVVHHLDLYRIADPEELELIGIRDLAAGDALWLVEWPERGGDRLPECNHVIRIEYADSGRLVHGLPSPVQCPEII